MHDWQLHLRHQAPPLLGVDHQVGEPTILSLGGIVPCALASMSGDCSLAPGFHSFGSLPNLIKGLYVPACTVSLDSESKGTA
jgi:hypothetical protein